MVKVIVCALFLLFTSSSEAARTKFTEADIAQAKTHEQQVALYQALADELERKSRGSRARKYQEFQTELGSKLAKAESQRIRAEVAEATLAIGLVPMSALNKAEAEALPIRTWNPSDYDSLARELGQQRTLTEDALAKSKAMQSELDDSDWVQQAAVLRDQWELFGDDAEAERAYTLVFDEGQYTLKAAGDSAMRSGEYGDALNSYETLKQLNPDFAGIGELISAAGTSLEALTFQDLLLEGNISGAYSSFERFSMEPMTSAQKIEFLTPASSLADYFQTMPKIQWRPASTRKPIPVLIESGRSEAGWICRARSAIRPCCHSPRRCLSSLLPPLPEITSVWSMGFCSW